MPAVSVPHRADCTLPHWRKGERWRYFLASVRCSGKPPLPERLCVGMGSNAQMMVKAREITRSPVLGCGVALTTNEYPMALERAHGDTWRLLVWIDRAADHREHRRVNRVPALRPVRGRVIDGDVVPAKNQNKGPSA